MSRSVGQVGQGKSAKVRSAFYGSGISKVDEFQPSRKRRERSLAIPRTPTSFYGPMSSLATLLPGDLRSIYQKATDGDRITEEEALRLYACNDLNALGLIANRVRERKNGNVATYIHNQYVNYSNVCILACQFCAFGARKRDAHAFESSIEEMVDFLVIRIFDGLGLALGDLRRWDGPIGASSDAAPGDAAADTAADTTEADTTLLLSP
jgi:hypothetical protein